MICVGGVGRGWFNCSKKLARGFVTSSKWLSKEAQTFSSSKDPKQCVTSLGIEKISSLILSGKPNKPLPAEFNLDIEEFNKGAAAAVEVVTRGLADGDYSSLEGLVTDQCIASLKQLNLQLLSEEKRKLLAVNSSDIFFNMLAEIKAKPSYNEVLFVTFSFPKLGNLKMMHEEFESKMKAATDDFKAGVTDQQQFKEITQDSIKGYRESAAEHNMYQMFQENEILIGNYRFIREDTSSSWIISQISQVNSAETWHPFIKTKWKGRLFMHLKFGYDFYKVLRYDYLSDWLLVLGFISVFAISLEKMAA